MELEHRSPLTNLTIVDPLYHGTGPIGGAERSRQGISKVYFTIKGQQIEVGLQNLPGQYQTEVPNALVYDLSTDSEQLIEQAQKASAIDSKVVRNEFERLVLRAGYKGYTDGKVVAWFGKLPVKPLAQ